jgi:hypothetical protein
MSHVSAIKLVIEDLDALEKAAELIGCELVRNQKTWKWYGKWVNDYHGDDAAYRHGIKTEDYGKCEHAIRVKGNSQAYEVGLVKNPDGPGFVPLFDFFAGGKGLQAVIGDGAGNLRREYALQVGMKEMQRKGFRTERLFNPDTGKSRMRAWR